MVVWLEEKRCVEKPLRENLLEKKEGKEVWTRLNFGLLLFAMVFLFSLPHVFSAPVTDLNLFVVSSTINPNTDLNFGLTWTGSEVNNIYVDWNNLDANTIISRPGDFYDFDAANGTTLQALYGWGLVKNNANSSATVQSNRGRINAKNDGGGGGATTYSDNNYTVEENGDTLSATWIWEDYVIVAGSYDGFRLGFFDNNSTSFPSSGLFLNGQNSSGGFQIEGQADSLIDGNEYELILTRVSNNTYDWELKEEGISVLDGSSVNLGTNTFYYGLGVSAGGVGTGDVYMEINDLQITGGYINTPQYFTQSYETLGTKTIQATVQNLDGNASTSLEIEIPDDVVTPIIFVNDFNFSSGFSGSPLTSTGNYSLGCRDTQAGVVDINIVNSGQTILPTTELDSNSVYYALNEPFNSGENRITFSCSDGFNVTTALLVRNAFTGNFYFVYDKTGVPLTSATQYTDADVNGVVAYILDDQNVFYDLYANNDVSVYFAGEDVSLGFRISYNDVTIVTQSRFFDTSVVDTNSVPVCFYNLEPYFEQLLYSSVERNVKLTNSANGCYHLAATTRYATSDSLSLSAYTIPLSYTMEVISEDTNNLVIALDGASSGSINLDSIVLKQELAQNLVITGDALTITHDCTTGDCNTYMVTYRNLASNNESTKFTIFNGTTPILTYTETGNPNNFNYLFDSTDLNFNADLLTLRLEKTRTNGEVVTESIYFTPDGRIGYIDPVLALVFSFLLFIGGITLVTARFLLGWFGLTIALIAVTILSFSLALWYVVFMQGIFLMMLIYIGIGAIKQEGVF